MHAVHAHLGALIVALGIGLAACAPEPAAVAPPPMSAPGAARLDLAGRHGFARVADGLIDLGLKDHRVLLTGGWHRVDERGGARPGSWSAAKLTSLVLPLTSRPAGACRLVLHARPRAFHQGPMSVGLRLNGVELGAVELDAGGAPVLCDVPAGVLQVGLNRVELGGPAPRSALELGVGGDPRAVGFRLEGLGVIAPERRRLKAGSVLVRRLVHPVGAAIEWSLGPGSGTWRLMSIDPDDGRTLLDRELGADEGRVELLTEAERERWLCAWPVGEARDLERLEVARPDGFLDLIVLVVGGLGPGLLDPTDAPTLAALDLSAVRFDQALAHGSSLRPAMASILSGRLFDEAGIVSGGDSVPEGLPLLAEHLSRRGYRTLAGLSSARLGESTDAEGFARGMDRFVIPGPFDAPAHHTLEALRWLIGGDDGRSPLFLLAHFGDPAAPHRTQAGSGLRTRVGLDGTGLLELDPATTPVLEQELFLDAGRHVVSFETTGADGADGAAAVVRALELSTSEHGTLDLEPVAGELGRAASRQGFAFELVEAGPVAFRVWLADEVEGEELLARHREELRHADASLGALVEGLKGLGRWDDALVIVTSDHGLDSGLRASKGQEARLFQEHLAVPLWIKPPAGEAWSAVAERLAAAAEGPVGHRDLAPTLLELAGQPPLPGQTGTSLVDVDLAAPEDREHLARAHVPDAPFDHYSIQDQRYKLIHLPNADGFVMFDLLADPGEERDVFAEEGAERPEWQGRLREQSRTWKRDGGLDTDAAVLERLEALGY